MQTTTEKNLLTEWLSSGGTDHLPFQAQRKEALDVLNVLPFPQGKSEEYRFTPVVRTLEKTFRAVPAPASHPAPLPFVDEMTIPGLDAYRIVLVNGSINWDMSDIDHAPFTISSLTDINETATLDSVFAKVVDFHADAFAAFNTARWTDGVFVHVAKGVRVEKPLEVIQVFDNVTASVSAHTRLAVVIESGGALSLVSKTFVKGEHPVFSTAVEEIIVHDHAHLAYTKIQNEPNVIEVNNTAIRQHPESHIDTFTLTLDGKLIRNNLTIYIDGEKCESHFHGLYLLDGETQADNHTVVDHKKPHAFSNQLYKGVMDGRAKGVFNGKIYVRPDAQKTNAFQSNRNILLSDHATVNTKPQLEIWADDVKCSHGCTTGQLDEEALFYLQSRGIQRDKAKAMLLYAFAADTFHIIHHEVIRNYVDSLISARLNKK